MDKVKSETIIKISYEGDIETGNIVLNEVHEVDVMDDNLKSHLEEIRREITYKDDELGILTFDKSISNYKTSIVWCGANSELVFETDDEVELIELIERYKENFSDKHRWDDKTRKYAASKLISLKNDFWLEDNEGEMKESEFVSLISLEALVLYPDGSYSFWYRDGDIFFGHVIILAI